MQSSMRDGLTFRQRLKIGNYLLTINRGMPLERVTAAFPGFLLGLIFVEKTIVVDELRLNPFDDTGK